MRRHRVFAHLGIDIDLEADGRTIARIRDPRHLGGPVGRYLNRGAILCLLETVVACAGLAALGGRRCATAALDTRFLRPAAPEGAHASARVAALDGHKAYLRAEVVDATGTVCARAEGVVVATRLRQD